MALYYQQSGFQAHLNTDLFSSSRSEVGLKARKQLSLTIIGFHLHSLV